MPHLLSHLNVDVSVEGPTIDWGTVAIFTCSQDCSADNLQLTSAYIDEVAWRQIYAKNPA